MASPMRLSIAITADASGVRPATEAARAEVQRLGAEAKTTATNLNLQAAAEAEAASAARATTAAITGQAAAQQQLRSNVVAINGVAVGAAKGTALAAHEVTNLTRQIADVGVSLASGQSPFMVMIQQGAQIQDVFGRRGVMQILSGLGGAISSLLTPTTMALLGITALGYGASIIFDAMQGDVKDVDALLEKHEDNVRRLKDAWGDAAKGIEPYARESRAVLDLLARQSAEDRRKALQSGTAGALAGVTASVDVSEFGGARAFRSTEAFRTIREEIEKLTKAAADGTPDFVGFQQRMVELERTDPSPQVRKLAAASIEATKEVAELQRSLPEAQQHLDEFGLSADRSAERTDTYTVAIKRLRDATIDLTEREKAANDYAAARGAARDREERDDAYEMYQKRLRSIENQEAGALVPIPTKRPNLEDSLPSAYEFIRTQDETIDRIKLEMALIGASEGLRARLIAQLDAEQEIRRRGIDAQGEEAQQLRDNASAIADATTELERHRDAWDQVQSAGENAIDGLVSKLAKGDIKGALTGLGDDFTKLMLDLAVANPLKNAAFGTNYGTLGDAGGTGAIVKRLFGGADAGAEGAAASILGKTVGSMTVNAGSVVITGAIGLAAGGTGGAAQNVTRLLTGANDNAASAGTATGSIADYIRQAARARGIDPEIALRVARSEGGLKDPFRQGEALINYGTKANPLMLREESYGPFQLHMRNGGLGTRALRDGIDPRANWQGGVDYALDEAANKGWGQWFGAAKSGIGNREGLEGARAIGQLSDAAKKATEGLNGLDTGITGAVKTLTGNGGFDWSSLFSSGFHESGGGFASLIGYGGASARPAAGGGGGLLKLLLGFLPSLFGFAEGTNSAPAGLAWVGERGRELIDFSGGERVVANHQLGNLGGGFSAPEITFINNGTPQRQVERREENDGKGGRRTVFVLDDAIADRLSSPGSAPNTTLRQMGARAPLVQR